MLVFIICRLSMYNALKNSFIFVHFSVLISAVQLAVVAVSTLTLLVGMRKDILSVENTSPVIWKDFLGRSTGSSLILVPTNLSALWHMWTRGINSITRLGLPDTRDRGRPRKTWSACVRNDMTICNLDGVNPLDRNSWRTSVRRCQVLPTPESGTTAAP